MPSQKNTNDVGSDEDPEIQSIEVYSTIYLTTVLYLASSTKLHGESLATSLNA